MQAQTAEIVYPESDGKPLADNTLQARWLVYLYTNLNALFPDFVATNLMWYPIQGNPKVALAPDILVALGRPKGDRSSYRNWEEGGPPEVVMEIRSPGNPAEEMAKKLRDYEVFGVQEYYMYDPHRHILEVYLRQQGQLRHISVVGSFDSPLLKIRFVLGRTEMTVLDPQLKPFLSLEAAKANLQLAEAQLLQERQLTAQAQQQAAQAQQRAERLAARLRALGLEELD